MTEEKEAGKMKDEVLQDWTFRYQYIYRLRRTNKQKQRFLSALAADIVKMREDLKVIEYNHKKKYVSSNLYVGDIERAEQIICTYYDTPPQSIGAYELFNRKKQGQAVTRFMLLSVSISLLIGLGLTWIYMSSSTKSFDFNSISTLIVIASYGLYFYLFSHVAKGLSTRRTLVRNTSSILGVLGLIDQVRDPKIAFAFIDEGCFGDLGLEALKSSNQSAKIYLLDCIGADAPLHILGEGLPKELKGLKVSPAKGPITHIFAANTSETLEGTRYYLEQTDLKKNSKTDNLQTLIELFKK